MGIVSSGVKALTKSGAKKAPKAAAKKAAPKKAPTLATSEKVALGSLGVAAVGMPIQMGMEKSKTKAKPAKGADKFGWAGRR